jgi:hypothetical protein
VYLKYSNTYLGVVRWKKDYDMGKLDNEPKKRKVEEK